MPSLALTVNQRAVELDVPREASLLHVLRNDLGLNGPKYGCGLGSCGACTVHAQAAQCGYCLNGMVMQAAALLAREPHPSDARIRSELSGNLCRCGTHVEILDAVARAAQRAQI